MDFIIFYDKQPEKFIKKLDKHIAERILDKIDEIFKQQGPVPHDVKTMVGKHGVFRIRIGDYRILYRIDYESKKIIIIKLDKRPNIY